MSVYSISSCFSIANKEVPTRQEVYKQRAITLFAVAAIAAAGTVYVATTLVALPIVIVSGTILGAGVTVVALTAAVVNLYWYRSMDLTVPASMSVERGAAPSVPSEKEEHLAGLTEKVKDPAVKETMRQFYLKVAAPKGLNGANVFLTEYKDILSLRAEEVEKAVWDVEKLTLDTVDIDTYLARNGYFLILEEPYVTSFGDRFKNYLSDLSSVSYTAPKVLDGVSFAMKLGMTKEQCDRAFFKNTLSKLASAELSFKDFYTLHGDDGVKVLSDLGHAENLFQAALKDPTMGLAEFIRCKLSAGDRKEEIIESQLKHLDKGDLSFALYLKQNGSCHSDVRLQKAFFNLSFKEIVSLRKHWNELGVPEVSLISYKVRLEEYITSLAPVSYKNESVISAKEFAEKLGVSKKQCDALFFADALRKLQGAELSFRGFGSCYGPESIQALVSLGHADILFKSALKDPTMGLVEFAKHSFYFEARKEEVLESQLKCVGQGKLGFEQYLLQNGLAYRLDFRLQNALLKLPFSKIASHKAHWSEMGVTSNWLTRSLSDQAQGMNFQEFLGFHGTLKAFEYLDSQKKALYRGQLIRDLSIQKMHELSDFKKGVGGALSSLKWLEGSNGSSLIQKYSLRAASSEWVHVLNQMGLDSLGKDITSLRTQYEGLNTWLRSECNIAEEKDKAEEASIISSFERAKTDIRTELKLFEERARAVLAEEPDVIAYRKAESDLERIKATPLSLNGSRDHALQIALAQDEDLILTLQEKLQELIDKKPTRSERRSAQQALIEAFEADKTSPVQGFSAAWTSLMETPPSKTIILEIDAEETLMIQLSTQIQSLEKKVLETQREINVSNAKMEESLAVFNREVRQAQQVKERAYLLYQIKWGGLEFSLSRKNQIANANIQWNEGQCLDAVTRLKYQQGVNHGRIEGEFNEKLRNFHTTWGAFVVKYEH